MMYVRVPAAHSPSAAAAAVRAEHPTLAHSKSGAGGIGRRLEVNAPFVRR